MIGGYLVGKYNESSQEYEDREELYQECGVGTKPKEKVGNPFPHPTDIMGDWRTRETITETGVKLEICLRLDTLPGAVKCFVTEYEGTDPSAQGVHGNWDDSIVLWTREKKGDPYVKYFVEYGPFDSTATSMTFFRTLTGGDFPNAGRLCYMFDEGPKMYGPLECEEREERVRCGFEESCQDKVEIVTYCFREEL